MIRGDAALPHRRRRRSQRQLAHARRSDSSDREQIEDGRSILHDALASRAAGAHQIQAAIAALHAEAASAAETDWKQIATLYDGLFEMHPTPVIELNAAVAHGMATSLDRALEWIARIEKSGALDGYHLLSAAKADLLRRLSRNDEATAAYRDALAWVKNPAERRYLERRLAECRVKGE
jgi:RNA polymerase sigma-70 factor (ECF subfamily)